jgi:hypothetical protein
VDAADLEHYGRENLLQPEGEHEVFMVEQYRQFAHQFPKAARTVLDIGCNTGRGWVGTVTSAARSPAMGLDVVRKRLEALPAVYMLRIRGLSTDIPLASQSVDVVVGGEFLGYLLPRVVDQMLYEFQRVRRRLLLTTPSPSYVRLGRHKGNAYRSGHLTQHYEYWGTDL